ncbi:MAG: metallophosphoesterase family protein [Phycisphaeraceae bacterium]|nr:metallophosphoesterase family protein [Phycisphaeraceae bacterium]
MATAVISDIHANLEALQTVLAEIDSRRAAGVPITRIISLGDIVGYGPDPLQCVDLVRERCEWSLMGNHDFGVLYEPTNFNPGAEAAAYWTREQFDAETDESRRKARYDFLDRLRVRVVDTTWAKDPGLTLLAVHGSPRRPINEYIFPDDVVTAPDKVTTIFERVPRLCIVGHTHFPGVFTDEPDFYPPNELTDGIYRFTEGEKAIINVGSVGQPRDQDPRASFVILYPPGEGAADTNNGSSAGYAEFVRVEYNIDSTANKIKAIPQLNDWLGDRLYEGR